MAIPTPVDLGGILEPVQVMLTRVLAYLPNVVAAGLILVVGWFVARIVRRIVTGLLAAAGTDRLGERVGLGQVLGRQSLSGLVGLVAYIFILVPVLISALNALQIEAVTRPARNMLDTFLAAIPNIFAAAVVLAIAYIVGRLVSGLVASLLAGIGFDTVPTRLGLTSGMPTVGRRSPSEIVGALVLVAVVLFATVEAFRLLNFTALADMLAGLVQLVGQVVLGLIVLAIGAYLANLAAELIRSSDTPNAGLLALVARVAILVLAGAMALRQMGIANEIVNLAFGLLLGAIAVAAALAFGFGGREVAGRELENTALAHRRRPGHPGRRRSVDPRGTCVVAGGAVALGTSRAQQSGRDMPAAEDPVTIVDESPAQTDDTDLGAPPSAIAPEVQDALRRQVALAIEPVLADFRKQSLRAVHEQLEQARAADRGQRPREARSVTEPGPNDRRPSERHGDRELVSADTEVEQPADEHTPSSRPDDDDPGRTDGVEGRSLPERGTAAARSVASDLVGQVPGVLEGAAADWLRSWAEDARDAMCGGPARAGVRRSLDHLLYPILEAGLELVPNEAARQALQEDSEHALDEWIEDALTQFCSERVLADLEQHAQQAIHALGRGDIGAALCEVWAAVQTLLRTVLAAAQDQWQHLVQLLLHFLLKAMQEMVGTLLKDGLAAIVPVQEIEEKAEAASETVKDRGAELKERLTERVEALQERVKEEVGAVKQRVADGLKSAVEDGTHSSSFGRPPTGRPPSDRPPSGRPPTGRPPSDRPPSGRPPSMTRRAT